MRKFVLSIALFVGVLGNLYPQSVKIIEYDYREDGKLYVNYEIETKISSSYFVRVFYDFKNVTLAMKFVTGDVGYFIKSDTVNQFVWDVDKELRFFDGNTRFSFDIVPMIPETKVKRGRSNFLALNIPDSLEVREFSLTGEKNKVNNHLIHFDVLDKKEENLKMIVGIKHRVGTFQVKATTSDGRSFLSEPFKMKRKVGTFWKVAPVVIGAAAIGSLKVYKAVKPVPDLTEPPPFPNF